METRLRRILRVTDNRTELIHLTLNRQEILDILSPFMQITTEKVAELLTPLEPHRVQILSKVFKHVHYDEVIDVELTPTELLNLSIVYATRISEAKFDKQFQWGPREDNEEQYIIRLRSFDKFWGEPISEDLCKYADEYKSIFRDEMVYREIRDALEYTGISKSEYQNYYIQVDKKVSGIQNLDIVKNVISEKVYQLLSKGN